MDNGCKISNTFFVALGFVISEGELPKPGLLASSEKRVLGRFPAGMTKKRRTLPIFPATKCKHP